MRVLTVRQPWAWAIIHGGKDVENRLQNIAGVYRGPVAIHAGKAIFEEEGGAYPEVQRAIWREDEGYTPTDDQLWEVADDVDPHDARFTYGAIIGVVDLVGVHKCAGTPTPLPRCYEATANGFSEAVAAGTGLCSLWADQHADNHLVLANPRPLIEPIPFRGALGLRMLPDEIAGQIMRAVAS